MKPRAPRKKGNGPRSIDERVVRLLRRHAVAVREDRLCLLLRPQVVPARVRVALQALEAVGRVVRSEDPDGSVRPCWAAS